MNLQNDVSNIVWRGANVVKIVCPGCWATLHAGHLSGDIMGAGTTTAYLDILVVNVA